MRLRLLAPTAIIALSLSLAGCVGGPGSVTAPQINAEVGAFSASDIMFAQMMIPHHEQAIALSALAKSNTEYIITRDLADRISEAQEPEIAIMRAWLAEAGASEDMGHSMSMPGMISDDDMRALEAARDDEFDVLFLTHMIAHHEGAIEMANDVLASTSNPDVKAFAEAVIAEQTMEIEEMTALLYG
jgi:uncharacterized protein (DUF305 family)